MRWSWRGRPGIAPQPGNHRGLPRARDLSGQTTVAGLVALIQQAAICVTNDSGSMHVAVAVGSPVVSVFGPTNPNWIGPYGRPHAVVRVDLPCAPCYLRELRNCPNNHICMQRVTAGMVIERVERVLTRSLIKTASSRIR